MELFVKLALTMAEPFIIAFDNGFGDNERDSGTGPMGPKLPAFVCPLWE